MRNLQKILALVLALIMSFSLVATAGAFSDDGDISDSYKTAINVLNGLEVFKGYDDGATFKPKDNITRAEVAAIIYRIATGDVKDSQASIYSTYGQFTDVEDGFWYSGYVNYCANAGYIKGRGNKIFDPQGQVTGYEALAMILRAVGYDKNGEFTGSNWQIRTASIANQRGITKNVTEGMLGQAATREIVAEILFRAILVNQVDFSANTLSYTEKATSLGYDSLKLEEIEGVITANEYADLNEDDTLLPGKTEMLVDGKEYTIEHTTTLDDIGESHIAYIQNGKKVLDINDREEGNVTAESVDKIKDEDALKDWLESNDLSKNGSTENFVNFSKGHRWQSDWRIRYELSFFAPGAVDQAAASVQLDNYLSSTSNNWSSDVKLSGFKFAPGTDRNGNAGYICTWDSGAFEIKKDIGSGHQANIKWIFNNADRFVDVRDGGYAYGEVYVGTSSLKDVSDSMSYDQFVKEYINEDTQADVTKNENGNWLKAIDNDKDGVVDYLLKVVYTTAQVTKVADDATVTLDVHKKDLCSVDDRLNALDDEKVKSEDTLAVNDVVYYALIDGVGRAYKATPVTAKIDKVDRNNLKITTSDGTEYTQSGVCEHIVDEYYDGDVRGMAGGVSYDMFLGRGDYLLAYVKTEASSFKLLVDGYYNSSSKGAEYAVEVYQDGKMSKMDINSNGSLFIRNKGVQNNGWEAIKSLGNTDTDALGTGALNNNNTTDVLRTTVAGLDENGNLIPVDFGSVYERGDHAMIGFPKNYSESLVGIYDKISSRDAVTNATAYVTNGKTAYNQELRINATSTTKALNPGEVEIRALSNTVYYFVYKDINDDIRVVEYNGYAKVPTLSRTEKQGIEDIYAVGKLNTRVSRDGLNEYYYTADVVVVEFNNYKRTGGETVFVVDSPVVASTVQIDNVKVIRANGEAQDVDIDLINSHITNYNIAGGKRIQPGIYEMHTTSTDNLYTLTTAYGADANGNHAQLANYKIDIGQVKTVSGTNRNDYVEIISKYDNTDDELNQYSIGDGKFYELGYKANHYNSAYDQDAELTASVVLETLAPRVNETNSAETGFIYDMVKSAASERRFGNYNDVLIAYTGSGVNKTIIYAVSFQNIDTSNSVNWGAYQPGNDGTAAFTGHGTKVDYAQKVWEDMIPTASADNTAEPVNVSIREWIDGDRDYTIERPVLFRMDKVAQPGNNGKFTSVTNIPYAEWKEYAGKHVEFHAEPNQDNKIGMINVRDMENKALNIDHYLGATLAIPAVDGSASWTFEVLSQGTTSGEFTQSYTYTINLIAPETGAILAETTPHADINLDGVNHTITGIPNENWTVEDFLRHFTLSAGATARWTFTTNGGTRANVVEVKNPAGNATPNNPASYEINWIDQSDLNNMSPVSLINPTSYSVTITPEYGSAVTYYQPGQKPIVPDDPTVALGLYNDAKTAFDTAKANGTLDADKNALLADLDAAMAALKALKNLGAEDQAKVDAAIADIEAMEKELGKNPEPTTDLTIADGEKTELGEDVVVDTALTLTVTGLKAKSWYWVKGGNLGGHCAARADENGNLVFTYTPDANDKANGLTITGEETKFMTNPFTGKPALLGELPEGGMGLVDFEVLEVKNATARMAVDDDAAAGEEGSVAAMTIGSETIYFVWVNGVAVLDKGLTPEDGQKVNEALQDADVDPDTGLVNITIDVEDTTITGDAAVSEDGTEINLALGQPKAVGAKLPTSMTIDGTVQVEVTWFLNGEEVKADENGNFLATAKEGYTYQVKTAVVENPEITLADTVTVTKGEGDSKETLGTVTKSDIEQGATVTPDDEIVVSANNKLVVEPITDRTELIANDPMIAANIQDNIQVEKQADGTTYKVSGTLYYTKNWTGYTSDSAKNSGYFIALKLTHPDTDSSMIQLNRGTAPFEGAETSKYLKRDGILVYKIAVKDNKADSFTATVVLDDGTNEVSTIDLSGLTLTSGTEETADLNVAAVDPDGRDYQVYGVDVANLQNITVDSTGVSTIKVTGTAMYFAPGASDTTWTGAWGSSPTDNSGYFLALNMSYPGLKAKDIKFYNTDDTGAPTGAAKALSDSETADVDYLVWKIKPSTTFKPINNIKVEAGGKTYIIDISGVQLRGTTIKVTPVDDSMKLLDDSKTAGELQSDIVVGEPVGNRIKVTGSSKYTSAWSNFDSTENDGHFVALKIDWPGVQYSDINIGWGTTAAAATKPLDDGIVVLRLENGDNDGNKYTLAVVANGIPYILDLSGVTREPDPEKGLKIELPRTGDKVNEMDVSKFNVSGMDILQGNALVGTLGYVAGGFTNEVVERAAATEKKDDHGFYVALRVLQGSTAVGKLWWKVAGSNDDTAQVVKVENGTCLIPVRVGDDMFKNETRYDNIEIATAVAAPAALEVESAAAPDWSTSIELDLSQLTLGTLATPSIPDSYGDVGADPIVSDLSVYQENMEINGSGTEWTVTGRLKYIGANDQYVSPENQGYYATVNWDTGVKGVITYSHTDTDRRGKTGPDGTNGWKFATEEDGRMEIMSLISTENNVVEGERFETTTYFWLDGIKYTVHWNVELGAMPLNPSTPASEAFEN